MTRLSAAESEAYFRTRPRASQLAAWASRQSTVIGSRRRAGRALRRSWPGRWPDGEQVPLPDFWGGYLVTPQTVEFWHGRANRMHDRLRYTRAAGTWVIERLAP